MSRSGYDYILLIAISAAVFLLNLGGPPLWDRDEPRNAGCAVEMSQRGDWIVPVFNAELRTHKPVLLYWLMMSSYSVFGTNAFAARFASAVLGCGTVLLTFSIGRRLFDRRAARWAGIILATTIMFGVASRAATPDSLLMFCGTAAIAVFVHGAFPRSAAEHDELVLPGYIGIVGMYAAMGFGVLAKGPVGVVLPTAVLGMYLLIVRLPSRAANAATFIDHLNSIARPFTPLHFLRTCWAMRPLTAIATVSAVALPWYVWVTVRTDGVWTREFLWTHNVSRATDAMEGHSGPPILFYIMAILVGFFPWSILTVSTGQRLWKIVNSKEIDTAKRRAIVFLLCWVGVYVVLFSLARTKLPSYVTPCYPAIALLVGLFVNDWTKSMDIPKVWLKVGFANLIVVGLLILVVLPIAAFRFLPGSEWLGCLGLIPLIGGTICWRQLAAEIRPTVAAVSLASTAVAFGIFLHAILPAEVGRHQEYNELFSKTAANSGLVAAFGHLEPSWIFYGGRPILEFGSNEKERFLQFARSHPHAMVITTAEKLESLGEETADEFHVVHSTEFFLRDRKLLLAKPTSNASDDIADRRNKRIKSR